MWLLATLYSLYQSYGPLLTRHFMALIASAENAANDNTVKALLDGYGLKPLIPALGFFLIIFLLHAHKRILIFVGSFVPPELIMMYMSGLKYVGKWGWLSAWETYGDNFRVSDIRGFVEDRYDQALMKRGTQSYRTEFEMLKALGALNFVLLILDVHYGRPAAGNLMLALSFIAAAFIAVTLHVYHDRNTSRWAIEDVLRTLRSDNLAKGRPTVTAAIRKQQESEAESMAAAEAKMRSFSFGWKVPLIGSLRILTESLALERTVSPAIPPGDTNAKEKDRTTTT